jgi:DNA repair protein RadA/Sms
MAKGSSSVFICSNCGAQYSTWMGRCQQCEAWNTLEEQVITANESSLRKGHKLVVESIEESVKTQEERLQTGLKEVDNVLGGGLVPGSITLIAGQPGIGKSTLLLQLATNVASSVETLYVSGEESLKQVGLRANRLKIGQSGLTLATSSSADDIASTIASKQFKLVIVDSIQSIACASISSTSGSVAQITNSTNLITVAAKQTSTAVIIVGHVTKEGYIAGPKVLEHLVDVVLQLDGDRYGGFKLLRAVKNRFGSINETGIFEMTDKGMETVSNPSAMLLKERMVADGSIVHATIEGTRPLLVEIQALVNVSTYGYPKRAASGFDLNRLNLLIAMLERRTKLRLGDKDVYINVVGGIKITEPAADLAICMAIASATSGRKLKSDLVVYGEVGLSGEVRHVPFADKRLAEAKKLGFKGAIGPGEQSKKLNDLTTVKDVREALIKFLEKS